MERSLPTFEIAGIPFIVDVEYNLLRHPDKDHIGYRFMDDMEDNGAHYLLYIDGKTLEPTTAEQARKFKGILSVDVPYMVVLDPEGVALKFTSTRSFLPDSDRKLENNADLMDQRETGKPAAIMIFDDHFFVDTENGYLVTPGLGAKDWLNVNAMAEDPLGVCYRCLYDPATKKEFRPPGDGKVPEGIVALEIPQIHFSDSYNYKRLFGKSIGLTDQEWFLRYPVRSNMKAREIPMEKMDLLRKAAGNTVEQQQRGNNRGRGRQQEKPGGPQVSSKGKGRPKSQGGTF